MCIVLLTTAHPRYALIVVDNRDEFILRPTSRPHWWTTLASRQPSRAPTPKPTSRVEATATNGGADGEAGGDADVQHILSSRDLQRAEHGTWLGITRSGHFAVLTNYRETDTNDANHPIHGTRSRGGMVTAWLGSPKDESVADFVSRMMADHGCKGVGGFSLICGKLRKRRLAATNGGAGHNGEKATLEPLAILSNRNDDPSQVPWIGGRRGEVYGLSNTSYDDPATWPKLESGKRLLRETIAEAVEKDLDEAELRDRLFSILDQDTLPIPPGASFDECIAILKHSIFIPPIGDAEHKAAMANATATTTAVAAPPNGQVAGERGELNEQQEEHASAAMEEVAGEERPDEQPMGFMTGMYGTQRQTVVLVDWDGNVTYTERALWDANGNAIERGKGDMTFHFKIEGWEGP
ncbi:DUF833 domain-containing protein [Pleurostoma richardsiae]|uniref:DUF833 domain-containing protein n=1 Tax=Pleurostoma richardsiae TaxID=41990 RepID=A0AA38RM25_9PEZI|nr:DUF833 domain-containing protein [Pleurostoma richardsiae]